MRIGLIAHLAWCDVRDDLRLFFCFATALAAILAPILVLVGLKQGVVAALRHQLLDNPRILEIASVGNRTFEPAFLAGLARRPGVAFLAPRIRAISATVYVSRPGPAEGLVTAELMPTGPGDPLLVPSAPALGPDQVVISHSLAARLSLAPGAAVQLRTVRTRHDTRETLTLTPEIVGIAPASVFARDGVFATLPLLVAIEDFLDGVEAPASAERRFAGFRLQATHLEAVAPLAAGLAAEGIDTTARTAEIEAVLALDRNLTMIFAVVAGLGGIGFAVSFGASLWTNVERKRRSLALLRLLGLPKRTLALFPLVQALLISAAGVTMAGGIAALCGAGLNAWFHDPGGVIVEVCKLTVGQTAVAGAATLAVALGATGLASRQAMRADPAEGVRDG